MQNEAAFDLIPVEFRELHGLGATGITEILRQYRVTRYREDGGHQVVDVEVTFDGECYSMTARDQVRNISASGNPCTSLQAVMHQVHWGDLDKPALPAHCTWCGTALPEPCPECGNTEKS